MEQIPSLLGLPREVRDIMLNFLAEEEDLTALSQTCRQLRAEVFARMPGGNIVNYGQPQDDKSLRDQIQQSIQASSMTLIAEPWYSSGSALKIALAWTPRDGSTKVRDSRWTIRDLSSPMARYIYWYRPETITIEFEAPTRGHMLLALLILRAKVFDICRILKYMLEVSPDNFTEQLVVAFRGGKDPSRPWLPRKSFWEMRPTIFDSARQFARAARWQGKAMKKSQQFRDFFPYFYECLMLPLFSNGSWMPTLLQFDLDPTNRRCSFVELGQSSTVPKYQGHRKLFEVARHISIHSPKSRRYYSFPSGPSFYKVITSLYVFNGVVDSFLHGAKGREADQLRAYLRRVKHVGNDKTSYRNTFSDSSNIPPPPRKWFTANKWPCPFEDYPLRLLYMQWPERDDYTNKKYAGKHKGKRNSSHLSPNLASFFCLSERSEHANKSEESDSLPTRARSAFQSTLVMGSETLGRPGAI
ncbi:hypothetical protein ABKA04_005339 [Annulohypoxylon sp. FPYF3050]